MDDIVVVYKSKYGSTEKYAKWIAEESEAEFLKYRYKFTTLYYTLFYII